MNKFNKLLVAVGLFALAGTAIAMPIDGSIGFGGGYKHNGTSLSNATTITPTDATVQGNITGDFYSAGIKAGDTATYAAFTFNPFNGPQVDLWQAGRFSFDLNAINVDYQGKYALALSGNGTIKSTIAGLDDTFGNWSFTANAAGSNFTWSSGTAPAPGIALLMAMGLAGISVASKMRKAT
jgi:hypothetical protein